jgi:RNA polymerase sigma-70 factor (ECF subfamily)
MGACVMTIPAASEPEELANLEQDRSLQLFSAERGRLFAIAYRMLGSVEDAEDIVQEAFLRWHATPIATLATPAAWLTTVVTRLALKQLQSARVTRESYIGPWLPEPLLDSARSTADAAELSDSLSIAFLTVLERLSPRERAVFLLREVFEYEYDEIALMVELTETNCRQIFHRARHRVADRKQRFAADGRTHRALLESFARAVSDGDVDGVVKMLARDAVLWADGGGRVRAAATRPVRSAESVARFLIGVRQKFGVGAVQMQVINGRDALIAMADGTPIRVVWIDVVGNEIGGIYVIANPEKLRPLARSLFSS